MCRLKSGIVLKNKIILSDTFDESHTDILERINISDTKENAMTKFVRVELYPSYNDYWSDVSTWNFNVDQDILPEFFSNDLEKYKKMMISEVLKWQKENVFCDDILDVVDGEYKIFKNCEIKVLSGNSNVILNSSTIQKMCGSSTVQRMYGSSTVQEMYESSTIQKMHGLSTVQRMYGSSTVQEMHGSSTVQRMYGSSTIQSMCGSSTIQEMYGSSTVQRMYGSSTVQEMYESSTIQEMNGLSTVQSMCGSTVQEMYESSILIDRYYGKIFVANDDIKIELFNEVNNDAV